MIVRYTNEEAQRRGDQSFSITLSELETFLALQYAREGIYGKNHVFIAWLLSCR